MKVDLSLKLQHRFQPAHHIIIFQISDKTARSQGRVRRLHDPNGAKSRMVMGSGTRRRAVTNVANAGEVY